MNFKKSKKLSRALTVSVLCAIVFGGGTVLPSEAWAELTHLTDGAGTGSIQSASITAGKGAKGDYSVAIGGNAVAYGHGAVAFGDSMAGWDGTGIPPAATTGTFAFASGYNNVASGTYSLAMGSENKASGDNSIAMGGGSVASNAYSVAMGAGSKSSGMASVAMGIYTNAKGMGSGAFGFGGIDTSTGSAKDTVGALGDGSFVTGGFVSFDESTGPITNPNTASGRNAVAMGEGNTASGIDSMAIGWGNQATGAGSFVAGGVGYDSVQKKYVVNGNTASGRNAVAMGNGNVVSGDNSFVMGAYSAVGGDYSVAIGYMNNYGCESGDFSVAIGHMNNRYSSGNYSVAMGNGNTASGEASVAIGSGLTSGVVNTSDGTTPFDGAYYTAAFGLNNSATGSGAFVAGGAGEAVWDETYEYWDNTSNPNTASGRNAVAMGEGNTASGIDSMAIGKGNTASGDYSVAMGNGATASALNSFAFGGTAAYEGSVALGYGSVTSAANEISVGKAGEGGFTRKITNVTAGTAATDAVNYGQVQGAYSNATYANNTLTLTKIDGTTTVINGIGGGGESFFEKVGTSDNIKMKATGKITNVSEGELSATSTDVVTGKQLFATNTQVETNKTNIATNATAIGKIQNYVTDNGINANNKKITNVAAGTSAYDAVNYAQYSDLANNMERRFSKVNEDIGRTGAASAALASLHPQMMRKGESQVMAGMGRYHGKSGAAVGLAWQPHKRVMLSGGFADAAGEIMFNVGASYKFGQHSYTAEQLAEMYNGNGTPLYVAEMNAALKSKDVQIMNLKSDNAAIKAELAELKAIVAELVKAKK